MTFRLDLIDMILLMLSLILIGISIGYAIGSSLLKSKCQEELDQLRDILFEEDTGNNEY